MVRTRDRCARDRRGVQARHRHLGQQHARLRLDVGRADPAVPREAARNPGHARDHRPCRGPEACLNDHLGGVPAVDDQPEGDADDAAEGAEPSDSHEARAKHAEPGYRRGLSRWPHESLPGLREADVVRRILPRRLRRGPKPPGRAALQPRHDVLGLREEGRACQPDHPRHLQALRLQPEHRRSRAVRQPLQAGVLGQRELLEGLPQTLRRPARRAAHSRGGDVGGGPWRHRDAKRSAGRRAGLG